MLQLDNLKYDSWQTIYFQRSTVIVSELVLALALSKWADTIPLQCVSANLDTIRYIKALPAPSSQCAYAAAISILLSPGLMIIDHIHFQYNGFLYGLHVLSIVLLRKQSTMLYGGMLFAALLSLKHIYLYLAPAYFVYLGRAYCLDPKSITTIRFANIFKLGTGITVIFAAAFGPFIYWGQMDQLRSRLFPFSRGLCHAYWAPNIWAMYSFADRVLLTGKLSSPRM